MKVLHIFTLFPTAKTFFDGQFAYLVQQGHTIDLVSSNADATEFCKRNKVRFIPINIPRNINPLADLKAITAVIQLIRRKKYDVVFGHTPKGALIAMIASWLTRTPKRVYYRHGLIYTTAKGIKRTILKSIERLTGLLATKIVNVSPSLAQLAISDKLNKREKQYIIGRGTCGGIDTETLFNPSLINTVYQQELKTKLNIQPQDFIVGFCGRICRDKGIEELVKGFNEFKRSSSISTKLLLVGPFDERDVINLEIRNTIEQCTSIISTGNIPKEQLPYYYNIMDVMVFPSYREGFGMCVLEASSMEKPILVSKSHGCIDSIIENVTGEYIDINPYAIAKALQQLHESNQGKILGKNGRDFVVRNFDFKVMWPLINQLYQEL